VIAEAGTGPELEEALTRVPDVLLLDIRMPEFDALTQVPDLRARYPKMKIVIVTAYESEFFAQELTKHVHGYVLKSERMDAFATVVHEVSKGRKHFAERALELILNSPDIPRLSGRERDVLKLAAEGLTTVGIGQELFVSTRTVDSHVQNASHKLGVRGRTAAVAKAIELGLISTGTTEDAT
jgi:DNA-binding NarL/FixJ family response regulator